MIRWALMAALLAGCAGCAHSTGTQTATSTMTTVGYAFAPPAFYRFCDELPQLCSTDGDEAAIALTPARMAELKTINKTVNRGVRQRDDASGVIGDRWGLPDGSGGDCEDLAILKKAELLKRGWPASTLLLTIAKLNGAGHAVLTVRTTEGDFVLDNRTDAVKPWSRTPYDYYARQRPNAGGGAEWVRIGA